MSDFRITYSNADGSVAVVVPAPGVSVEEAMKAVPAGAAHNVVDKTAIPADRTFRNAWVKNGAAIGHDMAKAKGIAHDKRRAKRATEFAPLDVEATIPAKAAQAEAARAAIRSKYDAMQTEIDAAGTVEALKAIVVREGL